MSSSLRPQGAHLSLELLEDRTAPAGLVPTATEQFFLERLNDARADPAAYGRSIGLDLSTVLAAPPLAFNTLLEQAARDHSQDMITRNYRGHFTPEGLSPTDRIAATGYVSRNTGESLTWYNASGPASYITGVSNPEKQAEDRLRDLIIDQGVPNLGHRIHLLAIDPSARLQREVGVGEYDRTLSSGSIQNYDLAYSIDSALSSTEARAFLTGVVYTDANGDNRYNVGEGLGNVTVTASNNGGSVTTWASGGYSLPLSPGTYTITFSGSALGTGTITQTVTIGTSNVRLNVKPSMASNPTPPPAGGGTTTGGGGTTTGGTTTPTGGPTSTGGGNVTLAGTTTVPTRTSTDFDKIGVYRPGDGSWSLDSDGSRGFTSVDRVYFQFSPPGITPVVGDWTNRGRDSIGNFQGGTWTLDLNDNGTVDAGDTTFVFGQAGDKPLVGNWYGRGTQVGVFRGQADGSGRFLLDTNNNHQLDAGDESFIFGAANDNIVVGDWTGDGITKVGVFRANPDGSGTALFSLDTNNDHNFVGGDAVFVFGVATDSIVIGDWNHSGTDKVGVYRPGADGTAVFSLDGDGNLAFDAGNPADEVFVFGLASDRIVVGNWASASPGTGTAAWLWPDALAALVGTGSDPDTPKWH